MVVDELEEEVKKSSEDDYYEWTNDIEGFAEEVQGLFDEIQRHKDGANNSHVLYNRYRQCQELKDSTESEFVKATMYAAEKRGLMDVAQTNRYGGRSDSEGINPKDISELLEINRESSLYLSAEKGISKAFIYLTKQVSGSPKNYSEGENLKLDFLEYLGCEDNFQMFDTMLNFDSTDFFENSDF